MGIDDCKRIWTRILELARKDWEDFNSLMYGGSEQSEDLSDSDEEEGDRWLGGDTGIVGPQNDICSNKL